MTENGPTVNGEKIQSCTCTYTFGSGNVQFHENVNPDSNSEFRFGFSDIKSLGKVPESMQSGKVFDFTEIPGSDANFPKIDFWNR